MESTRRLELEGAYNVRDLGGYKTVDGHRTRWKTFLRSDGMHRLSARDQATLLGYGIRTVVDLRRTKEVEEAPNVFEHSDRVSYLHHNLSGDDLQAIAPEPVADLDPVHRIAQSYSRGLDNRQAQYRDALAALASPGTLPAIFHCTAGKDRTGLIAALILGNAAVPTETIVEDYALSGRYWFEACLATDTDPDVALRVHTWQEFQGQACPPAAMLQVLQHLEDRYGGIQVYMRTIGLTDEQIESLRTAALE
jgi:protein-tyrosine phosphatase